MLTSNTRRGDLFLRNEKGGPCACFAIMTLTDNYFLYFYGDGNIACYKTDSNITEDYWVKVNA